MKKLAFYAFILTCGFLNMGAGCAKDSEKTPEPKTAEFPPLVGHWVLVIGSSYGSNSPATEGWKKTVQLKRGLVSYDFFADGKMKSYDNSGHFPAEEGDWAFEAKNVADKDLILGFLKIYTAFTRANANSANKEFIEPDGGIHFHASTETVEGKVYLKLTTRAYESYPYKYAYNEYFFEHK